MTIHAPDVVLMDVRMEGVDGIETTAALRLAHPEVAVVVRRTLRAAVTESNVPAGRRVSPEASVTITTAAFKLVNKGGRPPVRVGVTYSSATNKATLDQDKFLKKGVTYTAKVTTGAKDPAGNALAKAKAWSFTVKK